MRFSLRPDPLQPAQCTVPHAVLLLKEGVCGCVLLGSVLSVCLYLTLPG